MTMIKNCPVFFKQNFQFQQNILSEYNKQVLDYQFRYNLCHPISHIWRHNLYKRTFFFYKNGCSFSIQISVVRFIYAGTNRTFTFYGSLFSAFSHFSREFIQQAVQEKNIRDSFPALTVSAETLRTWCSLPDFRFPPRSPAPSLPAQ